MGPAGPSETMAPAYPTARRHISQTMTSHSTPWEYDISSTSAPFFLTGAAICDHTQVDALKNLLAYKKKKNQGVDCVSNVMAHAQKPDFVFRRNGRVHLNRRGASARSTTGSRGVRSNAGYTMV
jgi:hypothetical protein